MLCCSIYPFLVYCLKSYVFIITKMGFSPSLVDNAVGLDVLSIFIGFFMCLTSAIMSSVLWNSRSTYCFIFFINLFNWSFDSIFQEWSLNLWLIIQRRPWNLVLMECLAFNWNFLLVRHSLDNRLSPKTFPASSSASVSDCWFACWVLICGACHLIVSATGYCGWWSRFWCQHFIKNEVEPTELNHLPYWAYTHVFSK